MAVDIKDGEGVKVGSKGKMRMCMVLEY